MKHDSFLKIVKEYKKHAPREEYKIIEELKEFVIGHTDCFERNEEDGAKHIAASIFLVTSDYKKALFLWHAKIKRWTQPGGHADGNPNIIAVVLKELEEETGIKDAKLVSEIPLDIYRFDYLPEVFGYRKSIYNLFFMAVLPKNQQPKIMEPEKCSSMRWATPEEALSLIQVAPHEGTERLIRKWNNLLLNKKKRDLNF